MFGRAAWTTDRLTGQLRDMGVRVGDALFVHTSLRAMGLSRGETPGLLRAYLTVLGPEGSLYAPTHTYSQLGSGRPPFRLDASCHPLIGAFPEWMRQQPGVVRSLHPTHSACGIGAGVDATLAGHERCEPAGWNSPLDRLRRRGGKVLLIGCGLESCTLLHLAEVMADVPYLSVCPPGLEPVGLLYRDGCVTEVRIGVSPLCSRGFPKMEGLLRGCGVFQEGRLGRARVLLADMEALVEAAAAAFREAPERYLCEWGCPNCAAARAACWL
ncbi:MAG TPA: AAC(3) family N-acetyltransferase [Candidatus Hydrogenedentes bacterium]|nr:AAC(3) family N-acetyltransferase [Candidatus Hydrogenedentota bacterium]